MSNSRKRRSDADVPATLDRLEGTIGYRFRNRELLELAVTHASAHASANVDRDYERLEFMGDRVLAIVVAEMIYREFPDEDEGLMAKRLNRLVRKQACATVGRTLELNRFIKVGVGEKSSGAHLGDNLISDACEAVLGAIYIDGGFQPAHGFVSRYWRPMLDTVSNVPVDAKSALQEWAQGRGLDLPDYEEISRSGPDHEPLFVIEVRVTGQTSTRGEGSSKRIAEQAAAREFLQRVGAWAEMEDEA